MDINQLKKAAAEEAVEEIKSGMIVGLGTGSTFQYAIEKIGSKVRSHEINNIRCIPSSKRTEAEARRLGIPLISFNEIASETHASKCIDVTIDGADEADENLNLIKGGGGALLREKILAQASKRLVIMVDETKLSVNLGEKFYLPVEVFEYSLNSEIEYLRMLGAAVKLRINSDGTDFITDEGNRILEARFGGIKNPASVSALLNERAGVAGHGLFIGMTSKLICAMSSGKISIKGE